MNLHDLATPHVRRVSIGPRAEMGTPRDLGLMGEQRAKLPAGHVRHNATGDRVPVALTWVRLARRPEVALPASLTEDSLAAALAARDGTIWPQNAVWKVDVVVDGVPGTMELPGGLTRAQAVETAWARISLIGAHARRAPRF